jgi:hypothetical protein
MFRGWIPIHVGGSSLVGMYQRLVSSPPRRDEERPHTSCKAGLRDRWPTSRGGTMPTVIGHHDVKDKDHWLASPKREEVFGPLGVTNIQTFVDPQNPRQVAVLTDVADMDVLMAAMQSEAMAEAMAYERAQIGPVMGLAVRDRFRLAARPGPRTRRRVRAVAWSCPAGVAGVRPAPGRGCG